MMSSVSPQQDPFLHLKAELCSLNKRDMFSIFSLAVVGVATDAVRPYTKKCLEPFIEERYVDITCTLLPVCTIIVLGYCLDLSLKITTYAAIVFKPLCKVSSSIELEVEKNLKVRAFERWKADLMKAASVGNLEEVKRLCSEETKELRIGFMRDSPIDAKDKNGKSVLMYAAENGHIEIARYLIENDADVDWQTWKKSSETSEGSTALMYAAKNGHQGIVTLLVGYGANINLETSEGSTALILATSNDHTEIVEQLEQFEKSTAPLIDAASRGNLGGVQELFLSKMKEAKFPIELALNDSVIVKDLVLLIGSFIDRPLVNEKDKGGKTALIGAARGGHLKVVEYLVKYGANIDLKDNLGRTALMWAARYGHVEVVKYLLENGASIDLQDDRKYSALIFAARCGHVEVFEYLVKHGANIDLKDNLGRTAWRRANLSPNFDIQSLSPEITAQLQGGAI